MKLRLYKVYLKGTWSVEVEAESQEEAEDAAVEEAFSMVDPEWAIEVTDVEEGDFV